MPILRETSGTVDKSFKDTHTHTHTLAGISNSWHGKRTHGEDITEPPVQLKYSHLSSCAFPCDLDAERVVGDFHLVKPLVLVGLWSRGKRQRHRDLVTRRGWVPDLNGDGRNVFACHCMCV